MQTTFLWCVAVVRCADDALRQLDRSQYGGSGLGDCFLDGPLGLCRPDRVQICTFTGNYAMLILPLRGDAHGSHSRKTICFSKSIQMHDIVIGLFVNRYEFGLTLCMAKFRSETRPTEGGTAAKTLSDVMEYARCRHVDRSSLRRRCMHGTERQNRPRPLPAASFS
jgi:hypothetical protein